MGAIFKYNGQLLQCKDLQKKLKRMKLSESDIEIIQDDIPNDILEKTFVELTRSSKKEEETEEGFHYYIFENSKGDYLWGIGNPDINYIKNFGFDISDYKLIDECIGSIHQKYRKWNSETKTGYA